MAWTWSCEAAPSAALSGDFSPPCRTARCPHGLGLLRKLDHEIADRWRDSDAGVHDIAQCESKRHADSRRFANV